MTVTCERWLWAPRSEIFFEHGQAGHRDDDLDRGEAISPWQMSPMKVTS